MHDPRYIKVEEDVYIDTKGGLTPQQRAWIVKIIVYGIGAVMIGYFVLRFLSFWDMVREKPRRASCQSNLKQIGLGIMQYTEDNDQRYPPMAGNNARYSMTSPYKHPYGWAAAILPYTMSESILMCPVAFRPHPADLSRAVFTDYWYNRNLSHTPMKTVTSPATTFMLGDSFAGGSARASLSAFPVAWKTDETSPLWRHLDGANYAFADGHVKWLSAKAAAYADTQQYHFSLKQPER